MKVSLHTVLYKNEGQSSLLGYEPIISSNQKLFGDCYRSANVITALVQMPSVEKANANSANCCFLYLHVGFAL